MSREEAVSSSLRQSLAEAADKKRQYKYERDQLQKALAEVKHAVSKEMPNVAAVTEQRDSLLGESETLRNQYISQKSELQLALKQLASCRQKLKEAASEKDTMARELANHKDRL